MEIFYDFRASDLIANYDSNVAFFLVLHTKNRFLSKKALKVIDVYSDNGSWKLEAEKCFIVVQ